MSQRLRILIVEDSEDDALLLVRELKKNGYELVFERVDTPEAMSVALGKRAWDIVISDYSMPSFNGLDALKLLKKSGFDLPFIIVSGKIGEDTAVEAMKAGAHDYLMKGNLKRLAPAIERELKEVEVRRKRKQAEEALQKSEERYRRIIELAEEGIWMIDAEDRTTFINKKMAQMLGYPIAEMIGKTLFEFMDEKSRAIAKANMNPRHQNMSGRHDLKFRRQDGTDSWTMVSASPIFDKEGRYVGTLAMVSDITERKKTEEQLKYLSIHDSLTGLYNRTYFEEEMKRLGSGRFDPVGIITCDIDGLKLINDTLGHEVGDQVLVLAASIIKECFREGDVVSRVGGDEFAIILPNTKRDVVETACRRLQNAFQSYNASHLELPLSISIGFAVDSGKSIAMKDLYKEADNSMYREKLHRSQSARSAIVQTLKKALEARDFITEGHVNRLQALIAAFAAMIGVPEHRLNDLLLFAEFHDIGKVGIPDSILSKSGYLTPHEYAEMRRHCEIGYRIANASPDLAPIADLILKHHEWWNGKGYPLGLREEGIPLECHILAIVDAYDSMTSERPYRKPLSHEEAIAELKKCAGTQFNPELVNKFFQLLANQNLKH